MGHFTCIVPAGQLCNLTYIIFHKQLVMVLHELLHVV